MEVFVMMIEKRVSWTRIEEVVTLLNSII